MKNNSFQKQLAKLRRSKRMLWLGILLFVLVVLWILISIFTTTKTSVISQELRDLAQSFVPRLESKVFDEIAAKRTFSEEELSTFPIFVFGKSSVDGSVASVDIMMSSTDNDFLTATSDSEEVSATFSANEADTSIESEQSAAASSSSSTNDSMDVPQSVTDFLDYMTENY